MGRPQITDQRIAIGMTHEELQAWDAWARDHGLTRSDAIRYHMNRGVKHPQPRHIRQAMKRPRA